ncbi:MAG: crossover junction endodeoxyribonuclease RuvC [Bacteroidales bacterium]|nr:crossover junction endodeoxyribonuclease RuvC [Bacteroidales bacterium]
MNKDKIILGIDPGTRIMGYGLLQVKGKEVKMLAMGVIDMHKCADIYLKLGRIYERVINVINSFHPDELAIEAPFCGKNVQSMLKLGRAQGVVIAAAISRQIPVHEYAPTKIKMTITGNGNASKEQVASVMQRMLRIPQENMLPWMDATDALAAAYCHYLGTLGVAPSVPSSNSASSWKDFARRNPGKVRGL